MVVLVVMVVVVLGATYYHLAHVTAAQISNKCLVNYGKTTSNKKVINDGEKPCNKNVLKNDFQNDRNKVWFEQVSLKHFD